MVKKVFLVPSLNLPSLSLKPLLLLSPADLGFLTPPGEQHLPPFGGKGRVGAEPVHLSFDRWKAC